MSPTAHWSPDDYYRASRAARQAWQATNAQLEIGGLDEGEVARAEFGLSSAAASLSSSPPVPAPSPRAGSTSQGTTRGGGANHMPVTRAASQKGA